jgi:nucleoside-triphosphatase
MHLFLQGPRKAGKSTLIRGALLPYQTYVVGFAVQRLMENGEQIGFRAVPADGFLPPLEAEYAPDMDGVFILRGKKNESELDKTIRVVESESRKPACRLILLDEIGGIELTSALFMGALSKILSGGKPCIGVLKSKENLENTSSMLCLGSHCLDLRAKLEERILRCGELLDYSLPKEIITDKLRQAIARGLAQRTERFPPTRTNPAPRT